MDRLAGFGAQCSTLLVFGLAALQGGRETSNQTLVVERLVQEANRSGLQHLRPDALFGCAVIPMIGMGRPSAIKRLCSSTPLKPGICTSVIRHDVSLTRPNSRKSSADANVATAIEATSRAYSLHRASTGHRLQLKSRAPSASSLSFERSENTAMS